ncbi:MAG: hypothetical protein JSS93_01090 [Bacteroidetes bacterium]|nr:hypothetical protein [Bacteroidota bacterium]MBS1558923.1 hypothetical protein [Bacteroidota bacterium]MBS1981347.1 hypothetical protein [Bacteroidota bacterium]
MDSVAIKTKHNTDSVNKHLQKIQNVKLITPNIHQVPGMKKADSVKRALTNDLNKPAVMEKKLQANVKKMKQQEIASYNQKVKVMRKQFKHHLDSLNKLPTKDPRVTKSMDSLRKKMNKLKNAKSIKDVQKGEQQLAKLQSGMNNKIKGFDKKVSQELTSLNKLAGTNFKIPNINLPNVKIPNTDLNLPNGNLNVPNANLSLPNSSLNVNSNLPNANVPNISTNGLPNSSLPNVPQGNLPGNVSPSQEINTLEKQTGMTNITKDVSQVEGELKNMNPGQLESTLEKDAKNLKEVKQFGGEALKAEQYEKMVTKWQSDPDYRKEMMVTQAKEQTINHFAGQEKQLLGAMQQLANVKKKYKDYEGTLDMFKKPGNPMKGRPFIERLVPGWNIQYQGNKETLLDFNPQVGYRLSGRLTAGIGWNERWGYDFSKMNYVAKDHVYGPRVYGQVKLKTEIYAMIAPEVMNALIPPSYNSPDAGKRKWVWSWMAGMKKEFRYSKKLMGNVQVLYNLFDKNHRSPYVSKFSLRMGFEIPLKKK